MQRRNSGYTLLEIMLVLLIVAGAGYLLLVQVPHDMRERKVALASVRLLEDLRETQQTAISENIWYKISIHPGTREYKIFKQGEWIRTVQLADGVNFGNHKLEELTLTPSGAPAGGLTIVLLAKDRERRVIIAPVMGRIRMEIVH